MKAKYTKILLLALLALFLLAATAVPMRIVGWLKYQPYKLHITNVNNGCEMYWDGLGDAAWLVLDADGVQVAHEKTEAAAMYQLAIVCQ